MSETSDSVRAPHAVPPVEETPQRFEAALEGLESIVAELESGQLGLEQSLARYEDGVRLLRHCHSVLRDVEQRIEILTGFNAAGEPQTEPFDAQATFDESATRGKKVARRKSAARGGDSADPSPEAAAPPEERRLF